MTDRLVDVVVPQLGEGVSEVVLLQWLKKVGDTVSIGEPLFEVDTEKSVVEVEAFEAGTLEETLVEEGTPVEPTQVVARLRVAPA